MNRELIDKTVRLKLYPKKPKVSGLSKGLQVSGNEEYIYVHKATKVQLVCTENIRGRKLWRIRFHSQVRELRTIARSRVVCRPFSSPAFSTYNSKSARSAR